MKFSIKKIIYGLLICFMSGAFFQCNKFSDYPVHFYASKGNIEAVLYHLDHGVDINLKANNVQEL